MKTMEVIALCMWLANAEGKLELIEHTYKANLGECLRSSRIAQRELDPMRAKFACGRVTAVVELDKSGDVDRWRIIKIVDHGYKDEY